MASGFSRFRGQYDKPRKPGRYEIVIQTSVFSFFNVNVSFLAGVCYFGNGSLFKGLVSCLVFQSQAFESYEFQRDGLNRYQSLVSPSSREVWSGVQLFFI